MGDRSLWTSVLKGFCNAGEAVLTAWLIERWFGRAFVFDDVRHVLGFVAAAALGVAASAFGGAVTMTLLHTAAPFWDVWRAWFLASGVGIVVVAPLVIGLGQLWHERPSPAEWIEGGGVLTVLVLTSLYTVSHPAGSWVSFSPGALVLPFLLWLTARCPPAFGITGAFVASAAVLFGTTFGIGRFGDASVAIAERVNGAQAAMMVVTIYTLILTALFAERRRHEAALKDSNNRLQSALQAEAEGKTRLADAMEAGQVMAFEWDAVTGKSRHSDNARAILGDHEAGVTDPRPNDFFSRLHPTDRAFFRKHVRELCPSNPSYALNFRFCCANGREVWLEETAKGEFDAAGKLLRIKGLTRDISKRKKAELALAERTMQLALAGKAARVGSFAYDIDTERMQVSAGYAAIHGFPDGTTEIARSEWQLGMHLEDRVRWEALRSRAHRERWEEYSGEYRIVRGGEVRWIEARVFVSYGDGRPRRAVGVDIDVTARKGAEEQQRTLNAELDHRVKNVLATVSAVAGRTSDTSGSIESFVAALDGRIQSMAATHELLSSRRWQGVPLVELLERQLAPYATSGNTDVRGPDVILNAEASQTIAMVIHELATNAAKYGALSTGTGRVSVRWYWPLNGNTSDRLVIEWQEIGGRFVQAPSKSGYGTSIITDLVPYELGGTADLARSGEGVQCRLSIPAKWVAGPNVDQGRGKVKRHSSKDGVPEPS